MVGLRRDSGMAVGSTLVFICSSTSGTRLREAAGTDAERGPSGRHHRWSTPLVKFVSNVRLSVAFHARLSRASSTCSRLMYGCSRRSASRSALASRSSAR